MRTAVVKMSKEVLMSYPVWACVGIALIITELVTSGNWPGVKPG